MRSGTDRPVVQSSTIAYERFLIAIAGCGGLLYGIDIGIIAAALLYLGRTVHLSVGQTSIIVAAVLGGSMLSSPIAGVLADWFGRRKMMIASGLMFIVSVGLIVVSRDFTLLFTGRLIQGMSGGVIAVVVPLYLAESLSANDRGKGTAIFQLMLTFGIVVAAAVGWMYTQQAEAAITTARGNTKLIQAASNHAWRGMFLSMLYPGLLFFVGSFFMIETPRWLFRKGRPEDALRSLRRLCTAQEADLQLREMKALAADDQRNSRDDVKGSLLQRKYVIPFLLACVILACTQATGVNSILGFLVIILKQAGMSPNHATQGDVVVKFLNCFMTVVAVALVDKKGRKFLLKLGTGGIILSLLAGAFLFHRFESQRIEVREQVQRAVRGDTLTLPIGEAMFGQQPQRRSMGLTVLYRYRGGDEVSTAISSDKNDVLEVVPQEKDIGAPLVIKHAFYGPIAAEKTGWLITICLGLFISFYSIGPGVVVWLTLSELMPTRIRSTGMGIALLLNQGVSTLIAAVFLPTVGNYGFYAMFVFWAACTMIYFLTAAFFLPETKGRTLEEIEEYFEGASRRQFS